MDLQLPSSKDEIEAIQSRRKRLAFERARRAPFYAGKLDRIDPDRLDDPGEWAKIPIIDKETLREFPADTFEDRLVICDRREIAEYWRSGGATGVPIYYPRTAEDMRYSFLQLVRCWVCAGVEPGDLCHMSFPFGVHPAGQLWSRTANDAGIGIVWVGAGNTTPSEVQLDLLSRLRPTLWMGMPSYGLHLANLAEARGIDLAGGAVRKLLVGAEALSAAKREKLKRMWGVEEVRDLFGMTEIGILGADSKVGEGFHIWTDQAVFEVVDPDTGRALPEGEEGLMVITPLFVNNATPFLRWSSGDIVSIRNETSLDGPFSMSSARTESVNRFMPSRSVLSPKGLPTATYSRPSSGSRDGVSQMPPPLRTLPTQVGPAMSQPWSFSSCGIVLKCQITSPVAASTASTWPPGIRLSLRVVPT